MKIHPYVYRLDHNTTGQYYFGFRCANKVPALEDIGIRYFTSSKTIKELGFENFTITVLAEFFDKDGAFNFESHLIEKHIQDFLCLNKALNGKLCPIRKFTTTAHRENLSKSLKGKSGKRTIKREEGYQKHRLFIAALSDQDRKDMFGKGGKQAQKTISLMSPEERSRKFGWLKNKSHSVEVIEKIRLKNTGKKMSDESKLKMSQQKIGRKQTPEAIYNRTKNFNGAGNPRAITVHINGISYLTKKDAMRALGWSKYILNKYLETA